MSEHVTAADRNSGNSHSKEKVPGHGEDGEFELERVVDVVVIQNDGTAEGHPNGDDKRCRQLGFAGGVGLGRHSRSRESNIAGDIALLSNSGERDAGLSVVSFRASHCNVKGSSRESYDNQTTGTRINQIGRARRKRLWVFGSLRVCGK